MQLPPLPLHQRRFRPGVISRQELGHRILVRQAMGEDVVPISHNFDHNNIGKAEAVAKKKTKTSDAYVGGSRIHTTIKK